MIVHYPVKNTTISQPFGFDNSNHSERGNFYSVFDNKHPGVDFPVSKGTEVYAAFSGIVVRREFHKVWAMLSEFVMEISLLCTPICQNLLFL